MKIENGNLDSLVENNPKNFGWFLGYFIPESSVRHSDCCEVKWARHEKGFVKPTGMTVDPNIKTVPILLSGKYKVTFPEENKEIILDKFGDYIAFTGANHIGEALEDTHLMVIRWNEK